MAAAPLLAVALLGAIAQVRAQVLTPPYFNLAEGRQITASATCGQDVTGPELYCKLVGANADRELNINLIQGQVCDYCDPYGADSAHPAEYAIDGTENWWQSPPLSRGMKFNAVNLTIDLGQEFHVAYVFITMANSPRPGVWVMERSTDYGKTFKPWQYFADSPGDCELFFGRDSLRPIASDDDVICDTQYSKVVPLEGGEIVVSLLNNRPSANNFFNSTILQEWTTATNIRLRLMRTKTLLGHLMSVARQDPSVTRRYFYSIKDISIGGRCVCNGHAELCDLTYPEDPYKVLCRCRHNTCGAQCEQCCPGYFQQAWRQARINEPFECEQCNCFGHSNECEYDEEVDRLHQSLDIHGRYDGGGVCRYCRHNTEGINCNRCRSGYYRPYGKQLNATDVCDRCDCDTPFTTGNCMDGTGQCECKEQYAPPDCTQCSEGHFGYPECRPCDCFQNGTENAICEVGGGQCPCLYNFAGLHCRECAPTFFKFPECNPCSCDLTGAVSPDCNRETGQCECQNTYGGLSCDQCDNGFYGYPHCIYCNCDKEGTTAEVCDKHTGQCICREGYGGARCDICHAEYYGYPTCRSCDCWAGGSSAKVCDTSGQCPCLSNFAGRACDQCSPGYFRFPECLPCNCDLDGSLGVSCDAEGRCQCKRNFDGEKCDRCREGFYNFPACEECNCDPAGVVATFQGCGSLPRGELCQCKERVAGRICNECQPLYYNLQARNPLGCQDCDCHPPGVLGGLLTCSGTTGQCNCKSRVGSRRCETCLDGYFGLEEGNLLGCTGCGCDPGGAVHGICDKERGQCLCRPRVTGRTCNEALDIHYTPTLFQFQYEMEDGRTPHNSPVRFGFSDYEFPDYSWKGYAIFSPLQDEVVVDAIVDKPSVYRVVVRYRNPGTEAVVGKIRATPENLHETEQSYQVRFEPASVPQFVTVAGEAGAVPSPFVLNPGRWSLGLKVDQGSIQVDYIVLLPAAYYEAGALQLPVWRVCRDGDDPMNPCLHLAYPNASHFDQVRSRGAYIASEDDRLTPGHVYSNNEVHFEQMVIVNETQPEVHFDLRVTKPGKHILLLIYYSPERIEGRPGSIQVDIRSTKGRHRGKALLYDCNLGFLCRQVFRTREGEPAVFKLDSNSISLVLKPDGAAASAAVASVAAVPLKEWSEGLVRPRSACVRQDGRCLPGLFLFPPDSARVEFESAGGTPAESLPEGILDREAGLVLLQKKDSMVEVSGKVSQPGSYVMVVHYYQPDYPEFTTDVLIHNGHIYEATLPIEHCPSVSGCRAVVRQADGNRRFQITENFIITIKEARTVWLDYVMVVPEEQYTEDVLSEQPLDRTRDFLARCASDNFYIHPRTEGFCRDAVFSLTTEYNNGALSCQCDFDGSVSFDCERFGGQCHCKPNVVGRRCEICRTGFYGFPDCKPCNCPSTALCDPETGECVCPPRVTGERCDTCMANTYGFDPIIGCEECGCSPVGTDAGEMQCESSTGQCRCRQHVVGKTCQRCEAGYYGFPFCQLCHCDLRGTTENICDQTSSECFCKQHVGGYSCDTCREGTFNLQEDNPDGCTKCFCFGKSTRCGSALLFRGSIQNMASWEVVSAQLTSKGVVTTSASAAFGVTESEGMAQLDLYSTGDEEEEEDESRALYWAAPPEYLANQLTAYGGFVNYTVTSLGGEEDRRNMPDLILMGADTWLLYFEPPVDHGAPRHMSVPVSERHFLLPSGAIATREQLMVTLGDLRSLLIRADYGKGVVQSRLEDVRISTVKAPGTAAGGVQAVMVEQCQCPENYEGLSCERCAKGHFRAHTGPYGGFCVPCQCNGHSQECDSVTGKCYGCQHNTTGDHCEFCSAGYHGVATHGTPYDCLICACPLPLVSNNFADSCEVSGDGVRINCQCKKGYYGSRCEVCAAGYFGRPEIPGESCQRCDCSGNIDAFDPYACDSYTGECLRCLNNTGGRACALCAPGYYGDAVYHKDCQTCDCDRCGTQECDSYTGRCECLPNVGGEKCDQCEPGHWGFESCQGCISCDCGEASDSRQCDDSSGQCRCRPGVGGRRCDRCLPGYWNYGATGCEQCQCKVEYAVGLGCNERTGQCECLPGVIGERCDMCPHRWVLIPQVGCRECDLCVHFLLDDEDAAVGKLHSLLDTFQSSASSYLTVRRLGYINSTASSLEPSVALLDTTNADPLKKVRGAVAATEDESRNLHRSVNLTADTTARMAMDAAEVARNSTEVERLVSEADQLTVNVVLDVLRLMEGLEGGAGPQTEILVREAQSLKEDLDRVNGTEQMEAASEELEEAKELLVRLAEFSRPAEAVQDNLKETKRQVKETLERLVDLRNHSSAARHKAAEASGLSARNKESRAAEVVRGLEAREDKAQGDVHVAKEALKNAREALEDADTVSTQLYDDLSRLNEVETRLNETLVLDGQQLQTLHGPVQDAIDHAAKLTHRAAQLNDLLRDTRYESESGLSAATAYSTIVDAIANASKAAHDANQASLNASLLWQGLGDKTGGEQNRSTNLLYLAREAEDASMQHRTRVDGEKAYLREVSLDLGRARNMTDAAQRGLERLPQTPPDDQARDANLKSLTSSLEATRVQERVQDIYQELPQHLDRAREIPRDADDAVRAIDVATSQVNRVHQIIPQVSDLASRLSSSSPIVEQSGRDVGASLDELRRLVAQAREQLDRIRVGVTFQRDSSLQVRNPPGLASQSASSSLSLYFRTREPNGFLAFLGSEQGTARKLPRTKTDDYLALELDGGHLLLTLDLGAGPERLQVRDKYVADGVWYRASVERSGRRAKLTVTEETPFGREKPYSIEKVVPGAASLLNLDQQHSKIYIGGFPTSAQVPSTVRYGSFIGEVEGLTIGDMPVSLWHFSDAENIYGAHERDKLVDLQPETGLRFGGRGYARLEPRRFRERGDVTLRFKTTSSDGLMFLAEGLPAYMSVDMRSGKPVFTVDQGHGRSEIYSGQEFNDDQWHTLEAVRYRDEIALRVDGILMNQQTLPGYDDTYTEMHMFVGGYPGRHPIPGVSQRGFDGCIDELQVMGTLVELGILESRGVQPGCPAKMASIVSFARTRPGFLAMETPQHTGAVTEVSLRFKSPAPDAVLFFATEEGGQYMALGLRGGALMMVVDGEQETSASKFDDDLWHVVSVVRMANGTRLDVDDFETYTLPSATANLHPSLQNWYLGGTPPSIHNPIDTLSAPLWGCIGDVVVDGTFLNLAESPSSSEATLGKCPAPEEGEEEEEEPPLPVETTTEEGSRRGGDVDIDEEDVDDNGEHFVTSPPLPPLTTQEYFPEPTPIGGCGLALEPRLVRAIDLQHGVQFGTFPYSRLEFDSLPTKHKARSEFSVRFRTKSEEGVIFYVADTRQIDFVALYLREGKVNVAFNCGSGAALLSSQHRYNDGNWHHVVFQRRQKQGSVYIDGDDGEEVSGESQGNTKSINVNPPYWVGGLDKETSERARPNLKGVVQPFSGCLQDMTWNSRPFGLPSFAHETFACTEKIEQGMFFWAQGGYIVASERYRVGLNMDITLDIRARNNTGLLLAVEGRKDFLVLQLLDGELHFSVDNGKGTISTAFKPSNPSYFCNGDWHNIRALKAKNVVTLAVDSVFGEPGIGVAGVSATDTNQPLFIGGHPNPYQALGVNTEDGFIGCMKNVHISGKPLRLGPGQVVGNVTLDFCPSH